MSNYRQFSECTARLALLTVRVGGFASSGTGGGAAESGDDGVVVRVGVMRVVHCRVVTVVFGRSSGDADVRFAHIGGTGRLTPAGVVLLRRPARAVVVVVALMATDHRRVVGGPGEGHLPPVAQLGGLGVTEDFGAFQGAVGPEACGGGAGGVIHVLAGRRDVDVQLRAAGRGLRGPGATPAHDGARLGVIDVIVVGGRGGSAQLPIVDAGGGHGVPVRGVVGAPGAGGRVR